MKYLAQLVCISVAILFLAACSDTVEPRPGGSSNIGIQSEGQNFNSNGTTSGGINSVTNVGGGSRSLLSGSSLLTTDSLASQSSPAMSTDSKIQPASSPLLSPTPKPQSSGPTSPLSDTKAQSQNSPSASGQKPNSTANPPASTPPVSKDAKKALPLEGKVICLDPGHQSKLNKSKVPIAPNATYLMPDFAIGTKGINSGVYEYSITLDVAKLLEQELTKLGAKVILTRRSSDDLIGNVKRAEIANDAKADIFIRIHCDGLDDHSVHGISVLYPGDKYIKDKKMLEKSMALSRALLESTVDETKAKSRGLSKRNDLVGFNYSKVPCTLIEMGFLTNADEDRKLNSKDYQEKLVKGMVNGIIEYYKLSVSKE